MKPASMECYLIAGNSDAQHPLPPPPARVQMNRRLGQPAINIYTDKDSGKPKGDATLSYEEPFCAKAAVEHFDGMLLILCCCSAVCLGSSHLWL